MRSIGNAEYDYLRGSTRVEVESSQMQFDKAYRRWHFHFRHIDTSKYDELRHVMYTPKGLLVYVHDGFTHFNRNGFLADSQGLKAIRICGLNGVTDWRESLDVIQKKKFGSLLMTCFP